MEKYKRKRFIMEDKVISNTKVNSSIGKHIYSAMQKLIKQYNVTEKEARKAIIYYLNS